MVAYRPCRPMGMDLGMNDRQPVLRESTGVLGGDTPARSCPLLSVGRCCLVNRCAARRDLVQSCSLWITARRKLPVEWRCVSRARRRSLAPTHCLRRSRRPRGTGRRGGNWTTGEPRRGYPIVLGHRAAAGRGRVLYALASLRWQERDYCHGGPTTRVGRTECGGDRCVRYL